MNRKKEYASPAAEVILLAPCENLALWETAMKELWRDTGYLEATKDYASAFVIQKTTEGSWDDNPGFTIKTS